MMGPAPWFGKVFAPQFQHHLMSRFIFHSSQFLDRDLSSLFQLVVRQVRIAEQVGIDRQPRNQIVG